MDESGIEATQAMDFGDYGDDETDDGSGDNNPVAYLNVSCQKGFPGKLFPVYEGDNIIGRGDDCKISIPLKALSREHACIEVKGNSHFIYDKGSRNRTRRNGHFLAASVRYELKVKDKLIFGDVECEYQLATQTVDDDETGSESMFQTAPCDEELDHTVQTNRKRLGKLVEEEDYASDASSDILEPTQLFAGGMLSMLGHKSHNGNSTLVQNVTVKDTPAAARSKRFTEDLVLPESESDTDAEETTKPPRALAVVADSQDFGEDVKSKLMGAATQAYVCESDITTDDEDVEKKSLLAAPTQAFGEDDDVSTCSEDSPQKKMLMAAATQAFVADSDDEKTPTKMATPTVAYDMVEGIEPTQGYDIDDENKNDGAKSDTSEEFVLEGDTDAEDDEDADLILAAPTLAYDDPRWDDDGETLVVSTDDSTQVLDGIADDATVAAGEEAAQVFDESKPMRPVQKRKLEKVTNQPITEMETQVFHENEHDTDMKTEAISDDATQVFDNNVSGNKGQRKSTDIHAIETQTFGENATQLFDDVLKTGTVSQQKRQSDQKAETQVFDDDTTQCFDNIHDDNIKGAKVADTQVFDDATQVMEDETKRKTVISKSEEMQDKTDEATQAFSDEEGKMFDITAASTLAYNEDVDIEPDDTVNIGGDDAMQVCDDTDATVAVSDDQTAPVEPETIQIKSREKGKQAKRADDTVPVSDDATQVFDETVAIEKTEQTKSKEKGKRAKKADETVPVFDDATQVFDETVAIKEDVETDTVQSRGRRRMQTQRAGDTIPVSDDATQVFDETVDVEETVEIDTVLSKGKGSRCTKKVDDVIPVSDDATQVFDETVAVNEDETVAVEELESPTTASRKSKKEKVEQTSKQYEYEEATQVFDETVPIEEIRVKKKVPCGRAVQAVQQNEDATQVFDEMAGVHDIDNEQHEKRSRKGKTTAPSEADTEAATAEEKTKAAKEEGVSKRNSGRDKGRAGKNREVIEYENISQGPTEINDDRVTNVEDKVNSKCDEIIENVETHGKRTRGGKQLKSKNVVETKKVTKKGNKESEKIEVESVPTHCVVEKIVESTNVRKGGRTRGKTAVVEKNEMLSEIVGKQAKTRGKSEFHILKSKEAEPAVKGTRGRRSNIKAVVEEIEVEAATQVYAGGESAEEAATRRYGEKDDDDLTPDLMELEDERTAAAPVVAEPSRGRTTLKSSLAIPRKKTSPSPKKVQFISQNSETGSESGETSRRSNRANKGKHSGRTDPSSSNKENTNMKVKAADPPQNSEDSIELESEKKVEGTRKSRSKQGTVKISVETENKLNETQKHATSTENSIESETENKMNKRQTKRKSVNPKCNSENKNGIENKVEKVMKPNGRGRTSMEPEISVKHEKAGRVTRTSLPAVLENIKAETSQKSEQLTDSKTGSGGNVSVVKEKGNGKTKLKGKVLIHGKEETEKEIKQAIDPGSRTSRNTKEDVENVQEEVSDHSLRRTGRYAKDVVETKKSQQLKESKSDITNDATNNNDKQNSSSRSHRSKRNEEKSEPLKNTAEIENGKKRKLDAKTGGDERESSPQKVSRTRRNKTEESNVNEVEPVSVKGEVKHIETKISAKGKANVIKAETELDTEAAQSHEDICDKSRGSARGKRGGAIKAVSRVKTVTEKEPKEEVSTVNETITKKSGRLKRKESASSSIDSQESERGETPAKRQKKKNDQTVSTPKSTGKRIAGMSTPKTPSNKQLEASVISSPTLRKTNGKAKVMFTGVVDEQGEKIVKELGGQLVTSITDCTHLVTDQVRRTVKFLCCLSRGVPIVSPQWLVSSKSSAFFVDPVPFLVSDEASERKYKFRLDHSIDKAGKEHVFHGFTFHITKSVKPEPQHMKDILKYAGAKCMNTMPDKASLLLTVVISCTDDQAQCEPAYKVGLPVMTAEFVLTGILRQEVDWQSFKLIKEENGSKRQVKTSGHETVKKRKR